MQAAKLFPRINDPAPAFVCKNNTQRSDPRRFRVPLKHVALTHTYSEAPNAAAGERALAALPETESVAQLRSVLAGGNGLGLFASAELERKANTGTIDRAGRVAQALAGAVVLFPPHEWDEVRSHMRDWFPDGLEAQFGPLPYTWDDIVPFAGVNFSEERWFVVLRGPMAGSICWFTHDGDCVMDKPWATDVRAWGERIWREVPSVLGGVIRYSAIDSIDEVPPNTELFPEEYVADLRTTNLSDRT
ncbi:MAG: hypothetical protein J0L78_00950 [Planctomycetes bacterium]|nr:hypothetical protein [Planctomycetota bacterium]